MKRVAPVLIVAASMACPGAPRLNTTPKSLSPMPAAEYIIQAFDRYPLVALSEMHGNTDTKDFLAHLIRQPGFAGKVNDIVIEFGNARYQDVLDRYIAGNEVDRQSLKRLWEETTQVSDIWSLPMYEEILADIRAANQNLPPARRFRVLAGDPPIDWSQVTSPADDDMNDWRDAHYAWVVEHRVRDLGRTALLFVGGAHISRRVVFPNSLIHLLDARYPGQTLVVSVVDLAAIDASVAARLRTWPIRSAASVRGTWLGEGDVRMLGERFSRGVVEDDLDAVLFLSAAPLVFQPPPPLAGDELRAGELRRRRHLAEATLPFRGSEIRFEISTADVTPQSTGPLLAVRAEMLRDPSLRVLVKGFADAHEREPVQLSTTRARSVTDSLVAAGIERNRLQSIGCGAARPLWSDAVEEEYRAANRRVEIVRITATAGCQPPSSFDQASDHTGSLGGRAGDGPKGMIAARSTR